MIVHTVELTRARSAAVYQHQFVKLGVQLRMELAQRLTERTLPDTRRPAENYQASCHGRVHRLLPGS